MRLRCNIVWSLLVAGMLCAHPAMADTDSTAGNPPRAGAIDARAQTGDFARDTAGDAADTMDPTPSATDAPVVPEPPAVPEAPALKEEIPKANMPEVTVSVSPQKGAIGDLIEWRVTVKKKTPEDRVVLPATFDFGQLEIQTRQVSGETADEQSMTQVIGVGLVAFETGTFEIPPQKLTVVDSKGNISEILSKPFEVVITSLIANEPEAKLKVDEKDGEVVMVDDYTLLYIAAGLAAVLVIVLLTLLVRKLLSLRKPKPGPPPPPPRPAHVVALEKLNAIKAAGYLEENMHKTFHLKLSEAFREYLGNRYDFDALERSTREIVDELRRLSLSVELHREVVQLLEDTDLVKFARYEPPKAESERVLAEAFRIVDVTTPKGMPAAGDKAVAADGREGDGR